MTHNVKHPPLKPEIGDLTVNLINPDTGKFDPHYRHFWEMLVKVAIYRDPDSPNPTDTLVEVKRNPARNDQVYEPRAVEQAIDALKDWLAADIPGFTNVRLAETVTVMMFCDDDNEWGGVVKVDQRHTDPAILLNIAVELIKLHTEQHQ